MQTFFERGSQKWPVHTAGDITHVILNNCDLKNIEEPREEEEQNGTGELISRLVGKCRRIVCRRIECRRIVCRRIV